MIVRVIDTRKPKVCHEWKTNKALSVGRVPILVLIKRYPQTTLSKTGLTLQKRVMMPFCSASPSHTERIFYSLGSSQPALTETGNSTPPDQGQLSDAQTSTAPNFDLSSNVTDESLSHSEKTRLPIT
jgi:hypothetical protein